MPAKPMNLPALGSSLLQVAFERGGYNLSSDLLQRDFRWILGAAVQVRALQDADREGFTPPFVRDHYFVLSVVLALAVILIVVIGRLFACEEETSTHSRTRTANGSTHADEVPHGESLNAFILPESGYSWTNSRNIKLHIRVLVPREIQSTTAVIVAVHGFGNHCNSARGIGCLQKYADALDTIMFIYDQEGHGYSGGKRGVVNDHTHLVDDLVDLVHMLYAPEPLSSLGPAEILAQVRGRELILCGESIGGGVALAGCVRLQSSAHVPSALVIFAPFLQAQVPFGASKAFVNMVESMPAMRHVNLPQALVPELKGSAIFANQHDITIFEMDQGPNVRSALLKAATAASIVAMCNAMPEIIPQLQTPVVICHDPEDAVAPIAGPLRLIELATCPRQLISLPGGLHAPHINKFDEVLAACKSLFSTHLNTRKQTKLEEAEELEELQDLKENGDEEWCMESPAVGKADVPLGLQHLRLERPSFWRFPLPNRLNETMVLIIYFLVVLAIASSPTLVAAAYGPEAGGWVLIGFTLYLQVLSLVVCVNYLLAILQTRRAMQDPQAPLNSVPIGLLVPMYDEDVDIVRGGLESINEQPQAPNTTVIIALEARVGAESNAKRALAVRSILTRVKHVYVFEHPAGVPGDIKGCGSNLAWAMNQFLHHVDEDLSDWLFLKLDAQVVIQPGLLTELEHRMLEWSMHRRPVVWQPNVLHTINSERAFAVGSLFAQIVEFLVIGLYGQPLISLFLFGQYAMPMQQYVRAGMHHPGVMAEDQAITIQCSWTNRSLSVQPLKHCVSKAPPLGFSLREAIEETLAQDTRFFVGSVLILPWNFLHNPSSLSALSFLVYSLLLRHFTTVAMPIMTFQSMFAIGYGLVRLPIESLEEAVNGILAVFNLAGPTLSVLMATAFAFLQHGMIAQWPGRASQVTLLANVSRIVWMPTLQLLVFLTEVRAFLLCIFYGSPGQHGPLQYRARKKIGAGQKIDD